MTRRRLDHVPRADAERACRVGAREVLELARANTRRGPIALDPPRSGWTPPAERRLAELLDELRPGDELRPAAVAETLRLSLRAVLRLLDSSPRVRRERRVDGWSFAYALNASPSGSHKEG